MARSSSLHSDKSSSVPIVNGVERLLNPRRTTTRPPVEVPTVDHVDSSRLCEDQLVVPCTEGLSSQSCAMLPLLAEGSSEPRVSAWCLNESVGGSGSTSAGTSNAQMFRMAAADPSSVSTVLACMLPEKGLLSGDTVSHNSAIEHALSSFPAIAVDNATTAPSLKDIDDSNEWLTGKTPEDAQDEYVFEEDEGLTWGHVVTATGVHEERFNLRSRGNTQGGSTQVGRDCSSRESIRQVDGDEDEEDDEGYHSLDVDDMVTNLTGEVDYI
ncbi:hypothetical protein V6N13_097587 [Hibiscus sabdariffa]